MTDRNHPAGRAVLPVVLVILLVEFTSDVIWMIRYDGWGDFRAYYTAAEALNRGLDVYRFGDMNGVWSDIGDTSLKGHANPYVYPPLFAALLSPLTHLPFRTAARLWVCINAVLWLATVAMVIRYVRVDAASPIFWLILLLGLRFEPALSTLTYGQVNIVICALVMAALLALRDGRLALAGFWLGLTILLKITPAVLILYMLAMGQHRALAWTAAFSFLFLAVSILAVGAAPHLVYAVEVLPRLSGGFPTALNQSLTGWCLRLWEAAGAAEYSSQAVRLSKVSGAILGGAVAWHLWRAERPYRESVRPAGSSAPAEPIGSAESGLDAGDVSMVWENARVASVCILLAAVVSPVTWSNHLVWSILPFAVAFRLLLQQPSGLTSTALFCAAIVAVGILDDFYIHPFFRRGPWVLLASVKLYGLLVLLGLLLKLGPPDRRAPLDTAAA